MKRRFGVLRAPLHWTLVAAALFLLVAPAAARPLCVAGTLDSYMGLGGGGCQIDDKLFSDFTYSGSGFGGAVAISASQVNVVPLSTGLNPGLQFSALWDVGPGQGLDSLIQYTVAVLPGGHAIEDISVAMAGFGHTANGLVTVAETTSVGNLFLHDDGGGTVAFDTLTFPPTPGPISVATNIAVIGSLGTAFVLSVTSQFSEVAVPQPPGLLLVGSSLLGLAGMGYISRKK